VRRSFGPRGFDWSIAGTAVKGALGEVAHSHVPNLRLPGHRKPLARHNTLGSLKETLGESPDEERRDDDTAD
jgi:hypothetical protein